MRERRGLARSVTGNYTSTPYAVSAADGSEQWHFSRRDAKISTIIPEGDKLYFHLGEGSSEGRIQALDRKTGQEIWSFDPGFVSNVEAPAVADGTVYFFGDEDLYALDAGTGKVKWKAAVHWGVIRYGYGFGLQPGKKVLAAILADCPLVTPAPGLK